MTYSHNLTERIENRIAENKSSVKTYKTYAAACEVGEKFGKLFATYMGKQDAQADYIVVYLPTLNKFTVVFQMMAFLSKYQVGGYLGWFANKGFFSI